MAGIYNEDESTDEEFGINFHLAERLRINKCENSNFSEDKQFENSKDFKQYCNMRRKKFAQEGQSSSSSSADVQTDNSTSLLPCSDMYHNKKRQNGDKNTEQLATKRTCHRSPDWREFKKKINNHSSKPDYFPAATSKLLHNKKSREHVNDLTDDDDSDFEIPVKMNGHNKIKMGCGDGSSKPYNSHSSPNHYKLKEHALAIKPSTSYINFLVSSSEDESKSVAQNGALKGGRPGSSDHNYFSDRLIGFKVNKLIDCDDSDDEKPSTSYRTKPLIFSSSDSDDFDQNSTKVKPNFAASNESAGHSHFYRNGFDKSTGHHSRAFKPFRPNQKFSKKGFSSVAQSRADNSEGCDRQFLSSDFQRKNIPHSTRPCRSGRLSRINMVSTLPPNGFVNGNNAGGAVRGRRVGVNERGRRSGSPHHRSNRYQHKLEDSTKCHGRSVSAPHSQKEMPSYVVRYPDVFDAEESENEYFTANSYSDTEASTEFLGGLSINTTFPSHGGSISCTLNCDGSTDDEISVVFSTRPHGRSNDSSRDTVSVEDDASITLSAVPYGMSSDFPNVSRADDEISVVYSTGPSYSRNNEPRQSTSRALGRRRNRGTHRQRQNSREVVSLSPDPVEQVRQVEEDERMARILQAQFDAEVDIDSVFPTRTENAFVVDSFSDDEYDGENLFDAVRDTDDSDDLSIPTSYPFRRFPVGRRGFSANRYHPRADSPMAVFFASPRIESVNRRRTLSGIPRYPEPLGPIFGYFPDIMDINDSVNYEALLSLDLDVDIYPRRLTKMDINRLPTRHYIHPNSAASSSACEVTHKRAGLNKECQVCLTDYETGDTLRILPCFHEFHTPCIDPWLLINNTCPVCRVRVEFN